MTKRLDKSKYICLLSFLVDFIWHIQKSSRWWCAEAVCYWVFYKIRWRENMWHLQNMFGCIDCEYKFNTLLSSIFGTFVQWSILFLIANIFSSDTSRSGYYFTDQYMCGDINFDWSFWNSSVAYIRCRRAIN